MLTPLLGLSALLSSALSSGSASAAPGQQLQALVDRAITSSATRLVVPPGDYLFNGTQDNFAVHGAVDLEIVATGATVWLWPGSYVDIRDSQRSTTAQRPSRGCSTPRPESTARTVMHARLFGTRRPTATRRWLSGSWPRVQRSTTRIGRASLHWAWRAWGGTSRARGCFWKRMPASTALLLPMIQTV